MATHRVRTIKQSFGTGGSKLDLSAIEGKVMSVLAEPVNGDTIEMQGITGDAWANIGWSKVLDLPFDGSSANRLPKFRSTSGTEDVVFYVEERL